MKSIDPSEEWRRFRETYSLMSEDELQAVANDANDLTEIAKEALRAEIAGRGLVIGLRDEPPPKPTRPHTSVDDLDSTDSVVRVVRHVSGLPEARRVQFVLEASNIPSCLGPDNLENADAFEPDFKGEVDVKVCDIDLSRALYILDQHLPPEQEEPEEPEDADFAARCPKCHSTEIFLQDSDTESPTGPPSTSQFDWGCDACGHKWNNDDIKIEEKP